MTRGIPFAAGFEHGRRRFVLATGACLAARFSGTSAADGVRRIGYLTAGPASGAGAEGFRALTEGLSSLGWIEGRTLAIDPRYADNRVDDLPRLAADLVRAKPDVIVSVGPAPTLSLKRLDAHVPIVFVAVADPVGIGLAKSLGRPDGDLTGLATLAPERLLAKQVELLREIVPRAARIAFLTNPGNPVHVQGREIRLHVARSQGLEAIEVEATTREGFAPAFDEATRRRADVMYLSGDPLALANRNLIAELALAHRLPVMYLFHQHVDAGGLVSYGVDLADLYRRAAGYVDRIFRGTKPADLPIEEPTRYLLVINMRTARALGLQVPPSLLVRAERVVE